jgi:hypothetical protein
LDWKLTILNGLRKFNSINILYTIHIYTNTNVLFSCWIDPQHMLYMIIFYFPLLLAPLINVLSFLAILTRHGRATFTTKYRFSMYLLIFITSHTFDALNKIHSTLYPGSPNFAFYILQSITFPCEGLYVAIILVLTEPEIVDKYKEFFSRCCGRSSTFGTARAWEEMDSGYREVRGVRLISFECCVTARKFQNFINFIFSLVLSLQLAYNNLLFKYHPM